MTFVGKWPSEHDEALKEYFAQGMSFAHIAAEINARFQTSYSRNAAIGRGNRLGLGPVDRPKKKRIPLPPARKGAPCRRPSIPTTPAVPPGSEPLGEGVEAAKPWPRYLPLLRLRACMCRWPYGERAPYKFCAQRTELDHSYCPPHERQSLRS